MHYRSHLILSIIHQQKHLDSRARRCATVLHKLSHSNAPGTGVEASYANPHEDGYTP